MALRRRAFRWLATVLVGGLALALAPVSRAGPPPPGGVPAQRGAADVYERGRPSLRDDLLLVVRDLKLRCEAWPRSPGAPPPGGVLMLVLDPTTSMLPEMAEVRDALMALATEGPRDLRIGVLGASAEGTPPGPISAARFAIEALIQLPLDGPKNLLAAVREAAEQLSPTVTEPRALVLVTREGGDAEDDVEATRKELLRRGFVFHSIAPEAAFERPWDYDFVAKWVADLGLTQRFHPMPRAHRPGEQFQGGEVPFGMVPYEWELTWFPLAQTTFSWGGAGRFPAPSGFGFWCLASLSWSTGGKCFVHNFRSPGSRDTSRDPHVTLYDMGFLNLFAPDLRPRAEVLKSLAGIKRARVLAKIWEHLASEDAPIVRDHGTLEISGGALQARAALPVRSSTFFETTFRNYDQVERARFIADSRLARVEQALGWWVDEARRETTNVENGSLDHLRQRVEANFDLMGYQLVKVRFHWGEVIAALDQIGPADFGDGNVLVRLRTKTLARGTEVVVKERLPSSKRAGAFVELMASARRMVSRYHSTPWAILVEKGEAWTVEPEAEILPPPPEDTEGRRPAVPKPAPAAPPPPPGVRPSSGLGGDTTKK